MGMAMSNLIAFDFETYLITPLEPFPKPVVLSWFDGETGGLVPAKEALDWFLDKLDSPEVSFVAHNLKFDLLVMLRDASPAVTAKVLRALIARRFRCTAQTEHLVAIQELGHTNQSVSLAFCAKKYLGLELKKEDTWRLRYAELDGVPLDQWPKEALEYSLLDASTTHRVALAQPDLGLEVYRQTMSDVALGMFSREALNVDQAYLLERRAEIEQLLDTHREECVKHGLLRQEFEWAPNGPKSRKLGPPPIKLVECTKVVKERIAATTSNPLLTKTGDIARSALALRTSGSESLRWFGDYKRAGKALQYADTYLQLGERVCVGYKNLVGTGRVSSQGILREAVPFNIQQVPRDFGLRGGFVAPAGHVLVQADLAGAELRALAQICYSWFGQSRMREAFIAGQDLHSVMGADLVHMSYDEFQDRLKEKEAPVVNTRMLGKIANFSLAGMSGPGALVRQCQKMLKPEQWIDLATATRIHRQWPVTWTGMKQYFFRAKQAQAKGYVECFRSGLRRRVENAPQAANTPFQNAVANIAKSALRTLVTECNTEGSVLFGCRPWAFVHDEVILAAPEARGEECAARLGEVLCEAMQAWLPDVPAVAEGQVLGYRWRK